MKSGPAEVADYPTRWANGSEGAARCVAHSGIQRRRRTVWRVTSERIGTLLSIYPVVSHDFQYTKIRERRFEEDWDPCG